MPSSTVLARSEDRHQCRNEDEAHDGIRQRLAHARRVREQKVTLQQFELFVGYACLRQQAEARVDAVCGFAHRDDLIHQRTRGGNATAVVRRQAQGNRALINAPQRCQRQLAGANLQDIRHQSIIGKLSPCSRAQAMALS